MISQPEFRRGDVVLVDFPYVTEPGVSKLRPAVIVQNDTGNRFSPNLIVIPVSSRLPQRPYPTNVVLRHGSPEAQGTGLDRDSTVQAEVILTIPKTSVEHHLGRLSPGAAAALDRALKVSLGLN